MPGYCDGGRRKLSSRDNKFLWRNAEQEKKFGTKNAEGDSLSSGIFLPALRFFSFFPKLPSSSTAKWEEEEKEEGDAIKISSLEASFSRFPSPFSFADGGERK